MRKSWVIAAAGLLTLAGALAWSTAARSAEPAAVASARSAGVIGERFDGYIGYAGQPYPALRRQVEAINIRRRALYIDLSRRRGVTAQEVGITAGCQLLRSVPAGGAYMLGDGRWRRRGAGEDIRPGYCRGG
jgi:uncharacterized protein